MLSVSVIIPAYNAEKFIKQAVMSVLEQSYPISEVIVVNDGSTDNTNRELLRLQDEHDVIKIISTDNKGASSARNAGLKIASSDIIAFLDSDDYWETDKINLQIDYLLKNDLTVLISNLNLVNTKGALLGVKKNVTSNIVNGILRKKISMMTPTLIFYRSISEDNNIYFNEKMRHYEDHLFIIELSSHGNLGVLDKSLVNRRIHNSSLSYDFNIDDCFNSIIEFERVITALSKKNKKIHFKDIKFFKSHGYFSIAHLYFRRHNKIQCLKYSFLSNLVKPNLKAVILFLLCLLPFSNYLFYKISSQNKNYE